MYVNEPQLVHQFCQAFGLLDQNFVEFAEALRLKYQMCATICNIYITNIP